MFVALSAGFASCSDDDDVDSDALIGTWQATHTEGWYKDTDYPEDDETWNGSWADHEFDSMLPSVITFGKDGKGTYKFEVKEYPCTWSLNGDKLSFTETGEDGTNTTTVKVVSYSATQIVVEYSFEIGSESGSEKTTYIKK